MTQGWIRAADLKELRREGRTVFRLEGRQIVLFDTARGIYACNNRCPHEGYPLRQGVLDENCRLTCNWHNWKFDLVTGDNQRSGDRLRTYPVEVRGDSVWIEIIDPPFEVQFEGALLDLKKAFDDHDYERLARELARIVRTGADPTAAMAKAIEWSHERMEFGWTHAYAGAADWLVLYDRFAEAPEDQLICLLEAVGHMADDTLREAAYPFALGIDKWDEEKFVDALEREDELTAIRLTRGAVAAGDPYRTMERGLARAALAHYASFGHAAIYVPKAGDLIRRLGDSVAEPLLLSLVRGIISAFREDLIPDFASYAEALAVYGRKENRTLCSELSFAGLNPARAMALVARHSGLQPQLLFRALLTANALNMLTFDLSCLEELDTPYGSDRGWLDFSHALTFADAVLTLCSRHPDLWPAGLLQMACFAGRNIGHADSSVQFEDWQVYDKSQFFLEATARMLDHGESEYIASVHLLKTIQAVQRLSVSTEAGPAGDIALAALNRLLTSPLRRKMVRRTARQAMRFIRQDI